MVLAALTAVVASACSSASPGTSRSHSLISPAPTAVASPHATATPTATASPPPPYAIAALRARPPAGGTIVVGATLGSGTGYTKRTLSWPSGGSGMTGVIDIPAGRGPFPVVIVNHGYVPVSQYYVGQDSSKYADALAAAGFLTIAPNYPGYSGSGPGTAGVPAIVAEAISDIDLVSELSTLPQADPSRLAVAGHSNGGGVSLILLAADPRVRAAVLYAPVSSDMADNARKWWSRSPQSSGGLPSPDADPAVYELMSPRGWFTRNTPPTLVMQGTADEEIPAAWTSATVTTLQDVGASTRFVSFPGAMHNFQGTDLMRANALAISWLRDVLR